MHINIDKTETQIVGKRCTKFQMQVYAQQLTQVDYFLYLGKTSIAALEQSRILIEE